MNNALTRVFNLIDKSNSSNLNRILKGEIWISQDFDWHEYK